MFYSTLRFSFICVIVLFSYKSSAVFVLISEAVKVEVEVDFFYIIRYGIFKDKLFLFVRLKDNIVGKSIIIDFKIV